MSGTAPTIQRARKWPKRMEKTRETIIVHADDCPIAVVNKLLDDGG